jgi:hypothetical protein
MVEAMNNATRALSLRTGLTLAVPVAVTLCDRYPLPGVHPESLNAILNKTDPILSLFAFGLNPLLSAMFLVEVGALVVRRWRSYRHGSPELRARLVRTAMLTTVVFAGIQAFFINRWLDGSVKAFPPGFEFVTNTVGGRLVIAVSLVTGVMILVGLANLIDRHGIGCGFSVLIAALSIPKITQDLSQSLAQRSSSDGGLGRALGVPALVLVGLAFATANRRGNVAAGQSRALAAPSSGLYPLAVVLGGFAMIPQVAAIGVAVPEWVRRLPDQLPIRFLSLAVVVTLFAWLFTRPALVLPLWRRAWGDDGERAARRAFPRAVAGALIFIGLLGAVDAHSRSLRLAFDAAGTLVVLCVALDVMGEWRFRRVHPHVERVWPEHRLYAIEPALAQLAAKGIAAYPRGLRHRALLAFAGPYVPVELLVPAPQAEEARTIVRNLLGEPPSAPSLRRANAAEGGRFEV